MNSSRSRKRRFGFTLVEILVTTVVIAVLAAVVLPAVAKQTSAADPARVLSDLVNIKMGAEIFANNMRPDFPGDLEDIVNAPGGTLSSTIGPSSTIDDLALDGGFYANRTAWTGPYVAQALPAAFGATGLTSWRAGANGVYNNDLHICDITNVSATCTPVTGGSGAFVTILVENLSAAEAVSIDNLIDGGASPLSGTFRHALSGATNHAAFYYALPYTQ